MPLFIVAIGILLLQKTSDRVLIASRAGQIGIIVALSVANAVALHTNMRRYTTGTVVGGIDLDANREWWWMSLPGFLGANAVWVIGSLALFGFLWFVLKNANHPAAEPAAANTPEKNL